MNLQFLHSLKEIGLSDKEARTYLAMLELGESSIIPIAKRAGIKRTTVYNYLEDFLSLGLISITVRNTRKYYIASNPNRLREIMQERSKRVEAVIPQLFSLYKIEESKPSVQMFEGVEGIKSVFNLAVETVGKKIDAIPVYTSGHSHVGDEFIASYLEETRKRRIAYRSLRLKTDTTYYGDYRLHKLQPVDNREIRIAPDWFRPESHIHMYDDKVAIFSQTKEVPYAFIISSQSYYQTMQLFFESVWRQSEPFRE